MSAWLIRLWLIFELCSTLAFAATLQSVSVKPIGDKTYVYFSGEGYFTHRAFALSGPERVVIDFANTRLACALPPVAAAAGHVRRVRGGNPNPQTLRLVFEVDRPVVVSSGESPGPGSRWNLRVELATKALKTAARPIPVRQNAPAVSPPARVLAPKAPEARVRQTATRTPAEAPRMSTPIFAPGRGARDVIVVIDPGHGGKDPGAIGPRRSAEKHAVLAIALKLKQTIDRQPGMRAVLTRTGDYYVGLRERLAIARRYNGDIFVSIHADAFINQQSNGASVFALSQTGATSEAARWLAEKENYSELGGVNLKGLDDQSGIVRSVLIDLSQTATIGSSLKMGGAVLQNLDGITRLHNQRVEQARFMVLKSPDIPSILVETGFISNPREERNLTNHAYQQQLAQAIFRGIKGYFWENPPHGTRIEAMVQKSSGRLG